MRRPWPMARCLSTAQRAPEAMLKAYNGGFIRNDRLCIRERPLRFSHRDDETCLITCKIHCSICPIRLHAAFKIRSLDLIVSTVSQPLLFRSWPPPRRRRYDKPRHHTFFRLQQLTGDGTVAIGRIPTDRSQQTSSFLCAYNKPRPTVTKARHDYCGDYQLKSTD